jgi:hypothetical protein
MAATNGSWDPKHQAIMGNLKALGERVDRVAVVSFVQFNELYVVKQTQKLCV